MAIDDKARISVVILTHNDGDRSRACLQKILDQLDDPLFAELIILDNASTDGTREYVLSLAGNDKVRTLTSERNLGVALGRQRLFGLARGDILASLDSDVEIHGTGYFRQARTLLARNPRVGVCGANGYLVHFHDGKLGLEPFDGEGPVDCVSGFCQIFPRKLLEEVQIDPLFSPFWCEDTDFCFQAKALGLAVHRIDPGTRLLHRYRSIETRKHDPRKAQHEGMLVSKWTRRVKLIGHGPGPRLRRRLRRLRRTFNDDLGRLVRAITKTLGRKQQ
jgi:glycosyltransferase involved in cell wall biosynthesis